MAIDLAHFIITGRLLGLEAGCSRATIVSVLGAAEIYTEERKSYPAMLMYGALEFRLRGDKLCVIGLDLLDDPPKLPEGVGLDRSYDLRREHVETLLSQHGVGWKLDLVMSEDNAPVLVTDRKVHLAFEGSRLRRACADFGR